MRRFLSRAWESTKASLGWSWSSAIKKYLPLGLTAWIYYSFGHEGQQGSFWNFGMVLAWVGGMVGAFVLHFLYNLWLAPYYLLKEHEDENKKISSLKSQLEPIRLTDFSDYRHHKTIELYAAACLWVELAPHYPLKDSKAIAKLSLLKSVIRSGQLSCQWKTGIEILSELTGGKGRRLSPDDDQPISMIALRKYADTIGDVPTFLKKVSIPQGSKNS